MAASGPSPPRLVGRYAIYGEIATGGMATVYYGRLVGPVGFTRTVAIKCLHPQFAKDPDFVSMFVDEARLAARIHHPNVVQTLDVVTLESQLFLVMEYVQGEPLAGLVRVSRQPPKPVPLDVVSAIGCGILSGLQAAHEATNERGEPLGIVHRDVSPQNVLVGSDGVSRLLDFGVAKASGRLQTTREGQLKGKIAYMSPEQLLREPVDRRTDVYAAGVLLWEMLTLTRLFTAETEGAIVATVLKGASAPPSKVLAGIPKAVDEVVMRALHRDPDMRFQTAQAMANALEECAPPGSPRRVAEWLRGLAGDVLAHRAQEIARIESDSHSVLCERIETAGGEESAPAFEPLQSAEEALSQVSSVSLSKSEPYVPPRSERRRWPLAAAAAVAAMVVTVALVTLRERAPSLTQPVPIPSFSAQSAGAPSSLVTAPSAALPSSDFDPSATPTPSAPLTSPLPHYPRAAPATRPGAGPRKAPCTIRQYVDDSGITHFVRNCK